MWELKQVAPEVFYAQGGFVAVDDSLLAQLKDQALKSPRKRCRICFHKDENATQQAMLIAMHRSSYVRPHRHNDKSETFAVIEGGCDAILFNDDGAVTRITPMSAARDGGSFFYQMPPKVYHTQFFKTDWLVFLETTLGPFDRADTEFGAWSPPETDSAAGRAYLEQIVRQGLR